MTPDEARARLHAGRLAWSRIAELAAVLAVTFVCFGVVTVLRWAERAADARGWRAVFVAVAVVHLSLDAALIVFLARCLYRTVRGRPLFAARRRKDNRYDR